MSEIFNRAVRDIRRLQSAADSVCSTVEADKLRRRVAYLVSKDEYNILRTEIVSCGRFVNGYGGETGYSPDSISICGTLVVEHNT